MANWGKARVATEPGKMKYVQGQVEGFAEKALGPYFFQFMQKMMPEAVDVMRNYLEARPNWTPTGEKRKAMGGNGPGRVDTGTTRCYFLEADSYRRQGLLQVPSWLGEL